MNYKRGAPLNYRGFHRDNKGKGCFLFYTLYTLLYLLYSGLTYLTPSLLSFSPPIISLIILIMAPSKLISNFDKMDLDSLIRIREDKT